MLIPTDHRVVDVLDVFSHQASQGASEDPQSPPSPSTVLEDYFSPTNTTPTKLLYNLEVRGLAKRPFSCDYCRNFSSSFEDVVFNHYPVCGSYPLPCPNKCDLPCAIERNDLATHVDNDCPLTVVDCD